MKLIITPETDDIEAAIRMLRAIAPESPSEPAGASIASTPSETPNAPQNVAQEPSRVRIAPSAYAWYKETHGEKLTGKLVAKTGETGSGKDGAFTVDDIKRLFPAPSEGTPDSDDTPKQNGTLTIDDVREVASRVVDHSGKGKVRELLKLHGCEQLSRLEESEWPGFVKDAAEVLEA